MKPNSRRDLLERALELPASDRAAIADGLIASLGEIELPEVEQAWIDVIEQRLGELDAGRARTIPWSEVRRRLDDL